MKRLSRKLRSLSLIDLMRITHLLLLLCALPLVLPGPLCRPASSSWCLTRFLPLLMPTTGTFLMLPSRINFLISSRVMADDTRSVSSGSTHTLVIPTLSKSAARRFWLTTLIPYSSFLLRFLAWPSSLVSVWLVLFPSVLLLRFLLPFQESFQWGWVL